MREEEARERFAAGQEPLEPTERAPREPRERAPQERDVDYQDYLEWRRQRVRPWYSQGWFWALLTVAAVAVVVWQLGTIGDAVRSSAEATREQTGAIRDQTQVMREQGNWLLIQLRAIEDAITTLGRYVGEALQILERSTGS